MTLKWVQKKTLTPIFRYFIPFSRQISLPYSSNRKRHFLKSADTALFSRHKNAPLFCIKIRVQVWLREPDLNRRPSGYEPDELPSCSIPRSLFNALIKSTLLIYHISSLLSTPLSQKHLFSHFYFLIVAFLWNIIQPLQNS